MAVRNFFSETSGRFDARWQIACEIRNIACQHFERWRQQSVGRAQLDLQKVDQLTRAAYALKVALDEETVDEETPVAQAYGLEYVATPSTRLLAECLILGSASDDIVARELNCTPAVIAAFCGLFFDVRVRTRSEIINNLMPRGMNDSQRCPDDVVGAKHRFALFFGWQKFLDWNNGILKPSTELRQDVAALVLELLRTRLIVGEPTEDLTRALARTVASPLVDGSAGSQGSAVDQEMASAVATFLQGMTVKVADPTDPAYQNLPAREPRAHEYFHRTSPPAA